jgi:hypothetical protein
MSSIFGPTGIPILDRLGAFIDQYRRRMDARNGNLFAASAGAWWRYYVFLALVLARYDRSNAAYVEVMEQVARRMQEAPTGGGSRPMTPEDPRHRDLLPLRQDPAGPDRGHIRAGVRGGLEEQRLVVQRPVRAVRGPVPREGARGPANKLIEHLNDPRILKGTSHAPGKASGIVTGLMYPVPEEAQEFRQTEDPHALLFALEEFIEAVLTFFEVNARKSLLVVS